MKNTTIVVWALMLFIIPQVALAKLHMSVVTVPEKPDGIFTGRVDGASVDDPDPNPCYLRGKGCRLRAFTISEDWLPNGKGGYVTTAEALQSEYPANEYPQIGHWWTAVTNKNQVFDDYLPGPQGTPCMVIAAADGQSRMIAGTIISNCARGVVQARTCKMNPGQILLDLNVAKDTEALPHDIAGVTLECSEVTNVRIETNTGEKIPLGGDSTSVAVLDWGAGWGTPGSYNVRAGVRTPVNLRVKTEGVRNLNPGTVSGSAVVNVSYE